jgi:purine-binding chemotaxis protein CheW
MTERVVPSRPASQAASEDAGAVLLVFRVEGREHALPVKDVVEVLRMVAATPLPEAPPWVGGVINFRGRVIPLIDVRSRLGAPRREPDLSTPIIVVETNEVAAGLVVDEVVEVLALRSEAVDPPGRVTASAPAVAGVARQGDRLILVLDGERLCDGSVDLRLSFAVEETREADG